MWLFLQHFSSFCNSWSQRRDSIQGIATLGQGQCRWGGESHSKRRACKVPAAQPECTGDGPDSEESIQLSHPDHFLQSHEPPSQFQQLSPAPAENKQLKSTGWRPRAHCTACLMCQRASSSPELRATAAS